MRRLSVFYGGEERAGQTPSPFFFTIIAHRSAIFYKFSILFLIK